MFSLGNSIVVWRGSLYIACNSLSVSVYLEESLKNVSFVKLPTLFWTVFFVWLLCFFFFVHGLLGKNLELLLKCFFYSKVICIHAN